MKQFTDHELIHWDGKSRTSVSHKLIGEEPLSIRVQGKPYSVVMRTPGDEIAHVAGFALAEGLVDNPDDLGSIAFCDGSDTNVVTVTLSPSRQDKIPKHLDRREFVSQTSCGLCGKQIVEELHQIIQPIKDESVIPGEMALNCLENLRDHQPLRHQTRAAHAAAIYNSDFELLSIAEDVGRHNALDKTVGKLFLEGTLRDAVLLILSSRISYELVQKAARARIPIILAISRPTALAVELASQLNMTLACLAKGSGIFIFCGGHRLATGNTSESKGQLGSAIG